MENPEIINEYHRLYGDVINAAKHLNIELEKQHGHVKSNPGYHNIQSMRTTRQKLVEAISAFTYTEERFIDETIIKMRSNPDQE